MNMLLLAFLVLLATQSSQSANILFFFQVSTYSHRITVWPLVEALVDRGHNVTFHTIFHPKDPNPRVREFFPKSLQEKVKNGNLEHLMNTRLEHGRTGTQRMALGLPNIALEFCQDFLDASETVDFMESGKIELVVIDALFNECGFGLAQRFGAKTMLFSTSHPFPWTLEAFGVFQETFALSDLHFSFQIPLKFSEKVFSTLFVGSLYYLKTWFYYPKMDAMFRKRFNDPHMARIEDIERETSLVLFNSHYSEEMARSLPPMFIPIGGLHCDWEDKPKSKAMPSDIAKFIEESGDDGFIYVSFGAELSFEGTSPEFLNIFYTAFRKNGFPFLWKWDGPRPKEMPPNVLTAKWMPQQDILSSPKCKAFITHGGLLGMQEAISYGVPMIALPVFAEQDFNAFRVERTGRGIRLEASTLTLDQLQQAIAEILTNPKYKENVAEASRLFKDRPQTPLETAVFWTEFVLRHNNTSVLKPTYAMDQLWFQRRLIDVWAFVLAALLATLYATYYLTSKVLRCILCRDTKAATKKICKVKKS